MRIVDLPGFEAAIRHFRAKRFERFRLLLEGVARPFTLIDLGGTQSFWEAHGFVDQPGVHITLLNPLPAQATHPNFRAVVGDARDMPEFTDRQFDVVFSNSAIEHVGGFEDQKRMAREVKRIGKRYYVQTPNRHFPLEPHFLFPGFQYLPLDAKVWLVQHFRMGHIPRLKDRTQALEAAASTELLTKRQLVEIFPEARIEEEQVLGLAKSYICHAGF